MSTHSVQDVRPLHSSGRLLLSREHPHRRGDVHEPMAAGVLKQQCVQLTEELVPGIEGLHVGPLVEVS
jgi:hypothetical protein